MAEQFTNNFYAIRGVIYEKDNRTAYGKTGTKTAGQVFNFTTIVLEVKKEWKGTVYSDLLDFECGKNAEVDKFNKGDKVEILFALSGREVKFKAEDGTMKKYRKTSAKAFKIKHMDIQYNDTTDVSGAEKPLVIDSSSPFGDYEEGRDLPF